VSAQEAIERATHESTLQFVEKETGHKGGIRQVHEVSASVGEKVHFRSK